MKIYDVSMPIYTGMLVYKNMESKQPHIETVTNGHVTESRISLDAHTGTHTDAPLHMINDGDTIESISIERLVGPCKVFDLSEVEGKIEASHLEALPIEKGDFILFKTKNSLDTAFNFEFVALGESGAKYLAEIGINGLGIDGLGVERAQPGHPTHKTLFAHDIIVIEGLRLKDVSQGEYFMVAAPLSIVGIDAAPSRVLLMEGIQAES